MRYLILAVSLLLFGLLSAQHHEYSGIGRVDSVLVSEGDTLILEFGSFIAKNYFGGYNDTPLLDGPNGSIGQMDRNDVYQIRIGCRAMPSLNDGSTIQLSLKPDSARFLTSITGEVFLTGSNRYHPVSGELIFWAGAEYVAGAKILVIGIEGNTWVKNANVFMTQLVDSDSQYRQYYTHSVDTVATIDTRSWKNLEEGRSVTIPPGTYRFSATAHWLASPFGDISIGFWADNPDNVSHFSWMRDHDSSSGSVKSLNQSENGTGDFTTWKQFYYSGHVTVTEPTTIGLRMRQRKADQIGARMGLTTLEFIKF